MLRLNLFSLAKDLTYKIITIIPPRKIKIRLKPNQILILDISWIPVIADKARREREKFKGWDCLLALKIKRRLSSVKKILVSRKIKASFH